MRAAFCRIGLVLTVAISLTACNKSDPSLLALGVGVDTPNEFAVIPNKPLTTPTNLTSLPPPTPGGSNLTDPNPKADAVAALGGNPGVLTRSGIPSSDAALIRHTTRKGVQPGIRQELATEDLKFRKGKDAVFFQSWFKNNPYFKAYEKQSLDQYGELARLRAAGVKTPAVSPKLEK